MLLLLLFVGAGCAEDMGMHPSDVVDPGSDLSDVTVTTPDPGLRDYGVSRANEPGTVTLQAIPRALTAVPDDGGIRLRWWDVEGAEAYAIYHGPAGGSTPGHAERVVVDALEWRDAPVSPGEARAYAVAAIIDGEEGPLSGEVTSAGVQPVRQRQLRIEMSEPNLDRLYSRSPRSDVLLPASVTILPDDEPMDVEGVRFRGAGSRRYDKFGFHIRLNNRPDWNFGTQNRRGGNRILTNPMWTDPTGLRDALGFQAYHDVELPSPRTQYVELYLNGIFEGFYVLFERIDREALAGWNLNRRRGGMSLLRDDMKGNRRRLELDDNRSTFGIDIDEMGEDDEERIAFLQSIWDWRGEMEDHAWEDLLELVRWAHGSRSGSTFAREFEERFHLDDALTFLALHAIFMDTDSLDADYWLYRDEDGDGLWRFLPWDKNLVLGSSWYGDYLGSNSFFRYDRLLISPLTNRIIVLLLDTPALREQLDQRIRELYATTFNRAWVVDHTTRMLPTILGGMMRKPGTQAYHRQPRQHHDTVRYLPHHLEQIAEFMDLRRAWVLLDLERRAGNQYGDNDRAMREFFAIPEGRRRCLTDRRGFTWACLRATDGDWYGSASVALLVDDAIDGVHRRYVVQTSRPFRGELTLYYQNTPGRNWVEREEWAGDQWRLDMVVTHANRTTEQVRSRVNPFANMVIGNVDLAAGVHTVTLRMGPVPPHRRSTVGDDDPTSTEEAGSTSAASEPSGSGTLPSRSAPSN